MLAGFFPSFFQLDKFGQLAAFGAIPSTIICGTKDKLTSIGHSRKMASEMPDSTLVNAREPAHGHLEARDPVNAALEELVQAAARSARSAAGRAAGGQPRRHDDHDGGRGARAARPLRRAGGVREPFRPRPARDRVVGDAHTVRAALDAHGGLLVEHRGAPWGALLFEPRGRFSGCAGRRPGVGARLGFAAQMASRAREIAQELGFTGIELEARVELPATINFSRSLG